MATSNTGGSNERLDRIEDKIDKLSNAIVTLARVEEKIADLETRRTEQHERQNRMAEKIDKMDATLAGMAEKTNFVQKTSWFVFSILITALVVQYFQ